MHIPPANIVSVVLLCIIAWRVIMHLRRNLGRQKVRPGRMTLRIISLSIITLIVAGISPHHQEFVLSLSGGLLSGVVLALIGLRMTRYEATTEGHFFTPNLYLGIGLAVLFFGRLIYRMIRLHELAAAAEHRPPALMQSALTLFLFGLVAGYYISYYLGIFIHCERSSFEKTNA